MKNTQNTDLERIVALDLRERATREDWAARKFDEALIALIAEVRADERERCAKACDELSGALCDEQRRKMAADIRTVGFGAITAMIDCAARIRGGW